LKLCVDQLSCLPALVNQTDFLGLPNTRGKLFGVHFIHIQSKTVSWQIR
jgi:hypothetical protein